MGYPASSRVPGQGPATLKVEVVEGRISSPYGKGDKNGRGSVYVTRHFDDGRFEYVAVEDFDTIGAARVAARRMEHIDYSGVRLPSYGESDEYRQTYGYRTRLDGTRYDEVTPWPQP